MALEGEKYGIRVNCLAPTAATRMLEGLMAQDKLDALSPAAVSPALGALVGDDAPTRMVLCAGAGSFEAAHVTLTRGVHLGTGDDVVHELAARLLDVAERRDETVPRSGAAQAELELAKAGPQLQEAA